ncbi:PilW family protein [Agaribacterium haliotis]|uniref:PilW family protein n=1 Tax=Agaribacterium haliotis TaxID=2013869 RepID=UPI000BB57191|nr:PilW family protein [Agaribacterium haliotis]
MTQVQNKQHGFSLVELLISILIVGFILAGVLSVIVTSRQSFRGEQEVSFMQENLRYAADMFARDLRLAGNTDCAIPAASSDVITINDATGLFGPEAIIGFEGTTDISSFPTTLSEVTAAGSDAFIVRYADPDGAAPIKSHSPHNSNQVELFSATELFSGRNLMLVDVTCRHSVIFASNKNTTASDKFTQGASCSQNFYANDVDYICDSPATGIPFEAGSTLLVHQSYAYFIDESDVIAGVPALKRRSFVAGGVRTDEIAQGIESMEVLYGVALDRTLANLREAKLDEDGIDAFVSADEVDDWENVVAVRVSLVLRSQNNFYDENTVSTINGVQYGDRFLRQPMTSTFYLRNRGV